MKARLRLSRVYDVERWEGQPRLLGRDVWTTEAEVERHLRDGCSDATMHGVHDRIRQGGGVLLLGSAVEYVFRGEWLVLGDFGTHGEAEVLGDKVFHAKYVVQE